MQVPPSDRRGSSEPPGDRTVQGRNLVAFDLETVPDPDLGRQLYDFAGDDLAVMQSMLDRRLAETGERSSFLAPPFHRVVCVSVAEWDSERSRFRLASLAGTEVEQLDAFWGLFAGSPEPRLVSWNGRGFDLPVLQYRSMYHGRQAPRFHRAGGEESPVRRQLGRGYLDRFDSLHVDLMDVLAGQGASSRVRLDDWSRILGLPGKTVTSGSEVFRHFAAGEFDLIAEYCELDALSTFLAYLVYAHHRGELSDQMLGRIVDTVRSQLAGDPRAEVAAFDRALEHWPRFLPTRQR